METNETKYMYIDMETGTVLDTNLVLVPVPETEEESNLISLSQEDAFQYGQKVGIPVDVDLILGSRE